jgi:hypothetical protein
MDSWSTSDLSRSSDTCVILFARLLWRKWLQHILGCTPLPITVTGSSGGSVVNRSPLSFRWAKSLLYLTLSALFLLLMQGQCAFSQVDEGAITGTVSDPTGAVIPNAQVNPHEHRSRFDANHHYDLAQPHSS